MNEIQEQCKILASLVVFRELYDKEQDIYGVIAEFIIELIRTNRKYQFNLTEITNLFNDTYDFSIPEAVISTAIRRLGFMKDRGVYSVSKLPEKNNNQLGLLQEKSLNNNDSIMDGLFSFIEAEKGIPLSENDKSKVVRSFYSFLLDDSNGNEYSEYISGFTIRQKDDLVFRNNLNKIREGLILYTGIKYSNLGDIGSWKTKLIIYLDTEILFHFAGYNGQLYKNLFQDFFNYVIEINNKAKKILIELKYFSEVKNEIDGFFSKAELIVEGKEPYLTKTIAMGSVIDGCCSKSDVLQKKTDLFHNLKKNGIYEGEVINYLEEENFKYFIFDKLIVETLSQEFGTDISENIRFLNYISVQRKDLISKIFEDIRCILLTGNMLTIKIASHDSIKPEGNVPFATTLNWITNRFWFKLNKGFGSGNFPLSFDIIVKAQMVLSSIINKSVVEKYDELQNQLKEGKITDDQAKARIVDLRSQTKKPEDIGCEEISPILVSLTEDSLEQFIKEQELEKIENKKHLAENKKLKEDLRKSIEELAMVESKRTQTHEELIKEKKKQLADKIELLNKSEQNKDLLLKKSSHKYRGLQYRILITIILLLMLSVVSFIFISNEILDKIFFIITFLLPFLPLIYFLIFDKDWNWNIKKFFENKKNKYQEIIFSENNFEITYLEKLKDEIGQLVDEISLLNSE